MVTRRKKYIDLDNMATYNEIDTMRFIMKKICTGCKVEKSYDFFGKDKKAFDGLNQKCKECCNLRAKKSIRSPEAIANSRKKSAEWQKKKRPVLNARLRQRYADNLEKCREYSKIKQREYFKTEKAKLIHRERAKKYKEENPEKLKAQQIAHNARRSGKLIRPDKCEICFKECKPHGHHEDYNKPLDIIWMCHSCHLYHHQGYRFHRERLNEKASQKEDAKVCSCDESARGRVEEPSPPS